MAQQQRTKQEQRIPTKRRRRRNSRIAMTVVVAVAILCIAGTAVFWLTGSTEGGDSVGLFSVSKVEVSGSSRYDEDMLIQASGISVGQSLFSVNKSEAVKRIQDTFPYIGTVKVKSISFSTIRIEVAETEVLGAFYSDGNWVVAGANNRILEVTPVESDRPERCMYLKGVQAVGSKVGEIAMTEENCTLARRLLDTARQSGLTNLSEIDITEVIDLRLGWNNQLTILLGTSVNLKDKLEVSVAVIRELLNKKQIAGEVLAGELDVTAYSSDDASKHKSVYIPPEVIANRTTTTEPTEPTQPTDENGDPIDSGEQPSPEAA